MVAAVAGEVAVVAMIIARSSLMSVIITFMFEPAKVQMNWASARGRINLRGDITARPEIRPRSPRPDSQSRDITIGTGVSAESPTTD